MKGILLVGTLFLPILFVTCNNKQSELAMVHKTESIFPKGNKITNNNFTGTAWLQMLVGYDSTHDTSIGNVTFEPKARTNWHKHPGGQILLCTAGEGYYQEKGKPIQLLKRGDVVTIPPNVVHWHGATTKGGFSHLAINTKISLGPAVWYGPVTDEEYNGYSK